MAHFTSGTPLILAMDSQASVNLSVLISMVGTPILSNSTLLSRPLELQAPQSPCVRMIASQRSTSSHSVRRMILPELYLPRTTPFKSNRS